MTGRLFVQGDESPGQRTELTAFRHGLREYAERELDRSTDRIVIIEPNEMWHAELAELWSGWPHAEIVTGTVLPSGLFYRADDEDSTVLSPDARFVRTHLPNAQLRTVTVPVIDLREVAKGAELLSLDARTEPAYADQRWALIDTQAVVLELPLYPSSTAAGAGKALSAAGFVRSGRAWGEAGHGSLWRRANHMGTRLRSWTGQARVVAGHGIVTARSGLPVGEQGRAWKVRARAAVSREITSADVFDPAYGMTHRAMDRDYVRHGIDSWISKSDSNSRWTLESDAEANPDDIAAECFDRFGVWPISFSYPGHAYPLQEERSELISPIIPGFPYAFSDPDEYMRTYGTAALAVTHRKAGWDCFRHVEILAAGSIPLMVDIDALPPFSMIHYPRKAMTEAVRHMRRGDGWPASAVFEVFRAHFAKYLTSEAMARYVLQRSGLEDAQRILFVDSQHPWISDYQSTLALIGIKQVLGSRIEPMYPTPWIYDDYAQPTASLYGRGFGYSRTVRNSARTEAERATITGERLAGLDPGSYDAVVIGSCSRNVDTANELLGVVAPERTVWLHTEDTPPLPDTVRWMKNSGAHIFVRAIDSGR